MLDKLRLKQLIKALLRHFVDIHKTISMHGCSESDKQSMWGLDGEELLYFDLTYKIYSGSWFLRRTVKPEGTEPSLFNICSQNLNNTLSLSPPDPPGAPLLYPKDHLLPSKPNTLVCQASGFYPAPVNFTWTRDQLSISSSSVSQAFPQSDGTFTQFSTIELLQPEEGQVYSCSLEHPALKEPATLTVSISNTNKPTSGVMSNYIYI
uniref:Ig-like domain-containing protein n=1 Tax=Neogobius melanostomus TaxID=47308 RepID=A0A8C6SK58_9GOBI